MLYKRKGSDNWYFDVTVRGRRYQQSTKTTKKSEALAYASKFVAEVEDRGCTIGKKAPLTREFWTRFNAYLESAPLDADTKRYYRNGWRLLKATHIAGMKLDEITREDVLQLRFSGGPANANTALKTLRHMLNLARDWNVLKLVPKIPLRHQPRRERLIQENEVPQLLAVAEPLLTAVLVTMLDTGARPSEILAFRWECFDWLSSTIFIPKGKTKQSRRHIPMSDRMRTLFMAKWTEAGQPKEGWVWPSKRLKGEPIRYFSLAKQWLDARAAAGLPDDVKLYGARHTFGTELLAATGNLAAVMQTMGHADTKTAMVYQHQKLDVIRDVVNQRNKTTAPHGAESRVM